MNIAQLLDQKIAEATNDVDKLEFTVMKCLYKGKFDELFSKIFGFDRTKIVQEVEKCLGRKLLKPNSAKQQEAAQQ